MNYTIIKNNDLRNGDLKPTIKIVLLVLQSYYNEQKGYSYPSQTTLMKDCCIKDKKTLLNALDSLEKAGYIKRVCGKGVNNKYFISNVENSTSVENHPGTKKSPQGRVEKSTASSTKKPHTRNTNTNTNTNTKYSDDSNEVKLANYLYKLIQRNNPKAKKPNIQSWARDVDLMIRKDNRTVEEIKSVIDYCQNDRFWYSNILSTKKLRDKFDMLYLKAVEKQKTPTAIGVNKNNYNSSICKKPRVIPVSNEIDLFAN